MSRRRDRPRRPGRGWLAGVALVVLAVLWVTLRPDDFPESFPIGTNLRPLEHHGKALQALLGEPANRDVILYYLVSDVLGNVLLFVPLGVVVAGALGGRRDVHRLAGAAGFGLLLSATIELLQLLVPGRATDVDDVIFNGVGALVGGAGLLLAERAFGRGRPARGAKARPRSR